MNQQINKDKKTKTIKTNAYFHVTPISTYQ